jgi:hypothetical protein
MRLDLAGPFDLVLSSDSLGPMPGRAACVERIASLQETGGTSLLMTQNPMVWKRRSTMRAHDPAVPNGAVEQWSTRRDVRRLLSPYYAIDRIATFMPGGDRGVLLWVGHRYIRGGMSRLVGPRRWRSTLEALGLGRELVITATRR